MSPPLTSLSPNAQADDVRLALKVLLQPWRQRSRQAYLPVIKQLQNLFPGLNVALTSSGRSAIYRLLEALAIKSGDEVIIQAFTCLAVPAAVKWAGATPIYADINLQTYNLDPTDVTKKISSRTRAIIIQHTFGIPGPIKELRRLADLNNLVLIEDLAHSLGASTDHQPLGTFGDASILSFGRDKTISSIFGGAVISADKSIIKHINRLEDELSYPPAWWVRQQLFHPILMSLIKPLYFTGGFGKGILVLAQKVKLLSKAVTMPERRGHQPPFIKWRLSPSLAILLAKQLSKLDRFTARRRVIATRYASALTTSPYLKNNINNANWLRFPIPCAAPQTIFEQAKKSRILLGDWYTSAVFPNPEVADYQAGSCPNAELASQRTLNLPTNPTLTDQQVDQIVKLVGKLSPPTHLESSDD